MAGRIDSFTGNYRFLSNFYPSAVTYDDILYPTVEHAFQAAKTHDPEVRAQVAKAPTPSRAKALGRGLSLRPDWEQVKLEVMVNLIRSKFCDPQLAARLLATGYTELIEGVTWGDRIWGCEKVNGAWVGRNLLGQTLMAVRDELRQANEREAAIRHDPVRVNAVAEALWREKHGPTFPPTVDPAETWLALPDLAKRDYRDSARFVLNALDRVDGAGR